MQYWHPERCHRRRLRRLFLLDQCGEGGLGAVREALLQTHISILEQHAGLRKGDLGGGSGYALGGRPGLRRFDLTPARFVEARECGCSRFFV